MMKNFNKELYYSYPWSNATLKYNEKNKTLKLKYVGVKALITLAVVITKKINTCILNFENSSMLFEF